MNWIKELSATEASFIVVFFAIYLFYFLRLFFITKKLKTSANSVAIKFFLRISYFALLIIAGLGPNFGATEMEARNASKEIYFAFDLSNSMNATDVVPSRLDKAKISAVALLDRLPSEKVGIMIFDRDAHLYTPLTFDHEIIKNNIFGLNTSLLRSGGTNFNAILGLLYDKFNQQHPPDDHIKVAVLITDGENFENIDNQWYKLFKTLDIHVYLVALGTNEGGTIPTLNATKKDSDGNEIITKLDLEQIAEIAKKMSTSYYFVNNQKDQMSEIEAQINQLKGRDLDFNQKLVSSNKYVYFLFLAFFLLSIDFLFTVKILKI
jgi:Ca-activated chloride channel homolog